MKHIAAGEAKNHFGQLLDMAQRNPVTIEKKGRPVVVVLSLAEYQHFERLEDKLVPVRKPHHVLPSERSEQFF